MTRASSVIDDYINKLAKKRKKGHGGKHTRPKKWSGARRPAGPATTALSGPLKHGKCQNFRFQKNFVNMITTCPEFYRRSFKADRAIVTMVTPFLFQSAK